MNLLDELKSLLMKDKRLITDDKLLKNKIIELALKLDKNLIGLLLKNKRVKKHFFTEVDKTLIFDKEKFMKFIDNKEFLPDSYTAFKNKIGLTTNGKYITKSKEVVLSWPYKDCILEGGQEREDEKREEIFHNEILAPDEIDRLLDPKVFTNFKRINSKGKHKVTEINANDNLIIKGNNLLILNSLKKKFAGQVKLIYIDPPYNTGNDEFRYNDNFNHSTWLAFMKNRLEIAEKILRPDGLIFIQCDDVEHAYLKVLTDEIFGREKFVSSITVRSSTPSGLKTAHKDKTIIKLKDHVLVYKKGGNIELFPQYIKKEKWDTHYSYFLDKKNLSVSKLEDKLRKEGLITRTQKLSDIDINDKNIVNFYLKYQDQIFQTAPEMPEDIKKKSRKNKDQIIVYGEKDNLQYAYNGRRLTFLSNAIRELEDGSEDLAYLLCDIWTDIDFQNTQNEGGTSFPAGKKPERLLFRILKLATKKNDLILDFYLGNGTTAAVAHKMGRRYIGIEQIDYGENDSIVRLKNVINGEQSGISELVGWEGGGDYLYLELKELNEEFVKKLQQTKSSKELLKIWEEMKKHAFLSYRMDSRLFDENIEEFKKLTTDEQRKLLIECLDKNNLYVNYSEIKDKQYKVSKEDIELNKKFYGGL